MRSRRRQPALLGILFILILCFLCISGPYHQADASATPLFGSEKVRLSTGDFPLDSTYLKAELTENDLNMLGHFTALRTADFSGSACYEAIAAWSKANPQVSVSYTVPLPDGSVLSSSTTEIDLRALTAENVEATAKALESLPNISSAVLSSVGYSDSSLSFDDLALLCKAMPEAQVDFSLSFLGQEIDSKTKFVDFSALKHSEVDDAAAVLNCLEQLETLTLGSESSATGALTWDDIITLGDACPKAVIDYSFTLYGKECNMSDTELDLNNIEIKDKGAFVGRILPRMRNCVKLDMDTTGVPDEAMAQLRSENPDVQVVWRIWFGTNYSVRTDTERVLASKPTVGGMISDGDILKYCTEIKYLDLGHNDELRDISFVSSMPKLEVFIIAMTGVEDISPLADCPELNYLELNTTKVADISALASCPKLRDLNIGGCPNIEDISSLFETPMDRLWIGSETPVPSEQVAQMRENFPECTINTTTYDPHGESWRYTMYDPDEPKYYWVPRYEKIRAELGYDYQEYSFYWLDPKCDLAAPPEFAGMYGKEVYGYVE